MKTYIERANPDLIKYFGPDYFTEATSPTINIYMPPTRSTPSLATVNGCTFANQRNHEVLGFKVANVSYTNV